MCWWRAGQADAALSPTQRPDMDIPYMDMHMDTVYGYGYGYAALAPTRRPDGSLLHQNCYFTNELVVLPPPLLLSSESLRVPMPTQKCTTQ